MKPTPTIEELHTISLSTLKRWIKNYKTHGLVGLERKQRSDKGERKLITKELEELVEAYHNDGFLCRAICQELAGQSVSLKEIIRARQQRKRELRKVIAERKSLMDTLLEPPVKKQKPPIVWPNQKNYEG